MAPVVHLFYLTGNIFHLTFSSQGDIIFYIGGMVRRLLCRFKSSFSPKKGFYKTCSKLETNLDQEHDFVVKK